MKLSTKFTLFATILSLASPWALAVDSNNKQGKQLRGVARNVMAVNEHELGKPQEKITTNKNELDEVVIEEFDDDDNVNEEEEDGEEDTDEMQAFIDFVKAKETVSASPAQKKAVVVEDDADTEDSEGDDEDELEAFIDFVDAKEKVDSQQKIVEEEEDDADDDVYFEDEYPGKRRALIEDKDVDEQPNEKTRALGHHGKKCYWYHGYKRCYSHHKKYYR